LRTHIGERASPGGSRIRGTCERVRVGRSTFYTHFADKEELLFSGFDDLRRTLRASRGKWTLWGLHPWLA